MQIGDTVSGLAETMKIDVQESEWPELLPFLFSCVQGNQTRQMESALRIISELAGFVMPVLLPQMNILREQLARCMMHPETQVKIAGLSATTSFIRELDEDSDRNKFQDLIPVMLQTVSNILSTEEQDSAEESLEAFIEIAETHPKFLRRHLDVIVNNMLQARSQPLDTGFPACMYLPHTQVLYSSADHVWCEKAALDQVCRLYSNLSHHSTSKTRKHCSRGHSSR